jgi:hypothetical protein
MTRIRGFDGCDPNSPLESDNDEIVDVRIVGFQHLPQEAVSLGKTL